MLVYSMQITCLLVALWASASRGQPAFEQFYATSSPINSNDELGFYSDDRSIRPLATLLLEVVRSPGRFSTASHRDIRKRSKSRLELVEMASPATLTVTDSGVSPICEYTRNAIEGKNKEHDILLRAARGEITERPAVWLKRQAGRYMPEFREWSEKVHFRERSENPDIAIKLSLQPWHKFGTDGVIMFSDICTPFPAFGIDWNITKGYGPEVLTKVSTTADMDKIKVPSLESFENEMPFLRELLERLRKETEGKTTLIGFVGAPWTLAAHVLEGGKVTKGAATEKTNALMRDEPEAVHSLFQKFAEGIATYASYQVSSGAQVIQLFESWGHHMSADTFEQFGKPYANLCIKLIKEKCPDTPIIYFSNGGTSYLHLLKDMEYDMLDIDSGKDMKEIRETIGSDKAVSGNVDVNILRTGSENDVRTAVKDCVKNSLGAPHIVNVGEGLSKDVPEENVDAFVDQVRKLQYSSLPSDS